MLKKYLITLFLIFQVSVYSNAAGTSDSGSSKVKSNYDKAVSIIKSAKKYEKKGKKEKANKLVFTAGQLPWDRKWKPEGYILKSSSLGKNSSSATSYNSSSCGMA